MVSELVKAKFLSFSTANELDDRKKFLDTSLRSRSIYSESEPLYKLVNRINNESFDETTKFLHDPTCSVNTNVKLHNSEILKEKSGNKNFDDLETKNSNLTLPNVFSKTDQMNRFNINSFGNLNANSLVKEEVAQIDSKEYEENEETKEKIQLNKDKDEESSDERMEENVFKDHEFKGKIIDENIFTVDG